MIKLLTVFSTFLYLLAFSYLCANDCCQSLDVSVGWRRDQLDWKTSHLDSSYIPARAKSHIRFKDINSYTISGKAKWAGSAYYIRLAAEYGLTDKGRAHERFNIKSPYLYYPVDVNTSDRIKRRSEVYDFNGAVGYPCSFFCSRLSVISMIGFSFHRQHLRVKHNERSSHSPSSYDDGYSSRSSSSFFDSHSSSSFFISSSNPFMFSPSSDPTIANELGLVTHHRTDTYRFTWYGFYIGADIAYALDCNWTLFTEFEYHFYDNCHRKRKSWTGVYFVDDQHKKGRAYGFNSVFGATYCLGADWYTILSVDYKWWKAPSNHDELKWKSVGAKIGLGYMY